MVGGYRTARQVRSAENLRRLSVKKTLVALALLAGAALAFSPRSRAQSGTSTPSGAQSGAQSSQAGIDQDIQMLRLDIRSKKKQMVAANLKLTDSEATKFWPIYDQYTADLVKINDEKYALIKEYADKWGSLNDDEALSLTNRALAVDEKVAQLRIRYVPIFNKAIPGTKVATFYQIERRLQAVIDLQLSSQIPLVQAQE